MKKKSVLILSSILATVTLVGATFAAYAVTDVADPLGIFVTPGELEEDTTVDYVTIRWGESTSKSSDISNALPGAAYKIGVFSLVATKNYQGVFSVSLTDNYEGTRPEGQKKFIDYLSIYLYDGAQEPASENKLPAVDDIMHSAMGAELLSYSSALGTPSGKEYSVYITVDESAISHIDEMKEDQVDITINWDAKASDIDNKNKTVYFASNWENAYLYTWGDKGCNHAYPGVSLSKIGINELGQFIYQGLLIDGYKYMIFSNGGQGGDNQTPDLLISDFDFTEGDLLFYKDDGAPHKAGAIPYDSSYVVGINTNMGTNPGPILHAWDWKISDIMSNLDEIQAANYKAIQISPLQPIKGDEYSAQNDPNKVWSLIYQPVGLCVADENENPIGDKYQLASLTSAAKAKGIDIIVDVIANHLAEGSTPRTLDPQVRNYEKTIYDSPLIHTLGNVGGDDNTEYIVRGSLGGLPDLQTENSFVEARVISMLQEYIDLGVAGFRFDAAKHIETPTDGQYASDFWPDVIGAINTYGINSPKLGKAPYCYGEILTVGDYRDWNGFTKYIDVTSDAYATDIRQAFNDNKEEDVIHKGFWINQGADYAVLYAETHDNFVKGHTSSNYDVWLDMEYGLTASRAGASSLYYARPKPEQRLGEETKIVVEPYKVDNKLYCCNALVSAANKLHNLFVGGAEYLSTYDGCVINARTSGDRYGAYIANLHSYEGVRVKIAYEGGYLPEGDYTDLVSGNVCHVEGDGHVNISFTTGIKAAVLVSNNCLS